MAEAACLPLVLGSKWHAERVEEKYGAEVAKRRARLEEVAPFDSAALQEGAERLYNAQ